MSVTSYSVNPDLVEEYGLFEIIAQQGNSFFINTGRAYDGYGNMLYTTERVWVTLPFPIGMSSDIHGFYGYLCIRMRQANIPTTYLDHPVTCLPTKTQYRTEPEFYIAASATPVSIVENGVSVLYLYPPLDANGVLPGVVLGKVYENGAYSPDMTSRSPLIATRDGSMLPIAGYNLF